VKIVKLEQLRKVFQEGLRTKLSRYLWSLSLFFIGFLKFSYGPQFIHSNINLQLVYACDGKTMKKLIDCDPGPSCVVHLPSKYG
jgi:hypothetical protein